MVNVLELLKKEEDKEVKEKKKGKMKTADTMPIKRTRFGADAKMQEADASQDQEEKASPSKKKKGP